MAMLRITGGEWRGRRITAPKGTATRPTAEKVREAVFATLGALVELEGCTVFDLFAGSGALGIEALSRGAAHSTFVEAHGPTAAGIRANLRALEAPPARWRVVSSRALPWLRKNRATPPPHVILMDPPYGSLSGVEVLRELAGSPLLGEDAVAVMEAARRDAPALPDGLELVRVKRYGDTEIHIVKKSPAGPGFPA